MKTLLFFLFSVPFFTNAQFTFGNIVADNGCIPYPYFYPNVFYPNGDMISIGRGFNMNETPPVGCIYPKIAPGTPYIGISVSMSDSNDIPYSMKQNGNSVSDCGVASALRLPNGDYVVVGSAGTSYVHDGFFSMLDTFDLVFITRTDSNLNPIWMHGLNAQHPWLGNPLGPHGLVIDETGQYLYFCGGIYEPTPAFPFTNGYNDIFVIKYDLNGNQIWKKQYGGIADDDALILADKHGGFYLYGSSASNNNDMLDTSFFNNAPPFTTLNGFIMHVDSGGNKQWIKTFGGTSFEYAMKMLYDEQEQCLVFLGRTYSNDLDLAGSNGGMDYFVSVVDTSGNLKWIKPYGGSKQDFAKDICINPHTGNYIIVGNTCSEDGDFNDKLIPQGQATFNDGYILEVSKQDGSIYRKQRLESNSTYNSIHRIYVKPDKTIKVSVGFGGNNNPFFPIAGGYFADLDGYAISVEEIEFRQNKQYNLYPNPSSNIIWIEDNTNNRKSIIYRLYNPMGQLIQNGYFTYKTQLSMANYPNGLYVIQLINEDNISQQIKFLKH